jgi:CheY-like chemotaxis protein
MSFILLIEPNIVLARTYQLALESAGHKVRLSRDAQSALQVLDDATPQLIIIEAQLTGHSGFELIYEIRSYPEWQDIPIILHTLVPSSKLDDSKSALGSLGIVKYLYKPQTKLSQLIDAAQDSLLITNV